jgi:hypothetical protein
MEGILGQSQALTAETWRDSVIATKRRRFIARIFDDVSQKDCGEKL